MEVDVKRVQFQQILAQNEFAFLLGLHSWKLKNSVNDKQPSGYSPPKANAPTGNWNSFKEESPLFSKGFWR